MSAEPGVAQRLVDKFEDDEARAAAHATHVRLPHERCPGPHFWRTVPVFDTDVHDLKRLARIHAHLFER